MRLPGIKINYASGLLGVAPANEDGLFAIASNAYPADKFELNKPYEIRRLSDLAELGITPIFNKKLYKHVKEFYQEAPEGTPVIVVGFKSGVSLPKIFDTDMNRLDLDDPRDGYLRKIVTQTNGRIRGVFVSLDKSIDSSSGTSAPTIAPTGTPGPTSTPTPEQPYTEEIVNGGLMYAQSFAEWCATALYAPLFVALEFGVVRTDLIGGEIQVPSYSKSLYNRVSLVVGDTSAHSAGSILGLMAGRLAKIPVQRNIGRVRDGALPVPHLYIGEQTVDRALGPIERLYDKGYIAPRTHVGLSGYYFTDDRQACDPTDDYAHLTNRRVADKAYRVAYNTLLKYLLDEVPIATDGSISPAWCASVAGDVEQAIVDQMTNEGNLGNDPSDPSDKGVECIIDYKQNILSNSKLAVTLRIKPNGYVRWIDVDLGFKTT